MKGFFIHVKNDLLEAKHVANMGMAVWLYMWLLDAMTSVNKNGIGKVKGGRPILSTEIQEELGVSDKTYRRWLDTLSDAGYISCLRAPYGTVITVNKAKKVFGKKADNGAEKRSVTFVQRSVKNVRRSVTSDLCNIKTLQDTTKTIGKLFEEKDHRGVPSTNKENIRKLLKEGKLKKLNTQN